MMIRCDDYWSLSTSECVVAAPATLPLKARFHSHLLQFRVRNQMEFGHAPRILCPVVQRRFENEYYWQITVTF